jgi:hypothetical protein
MRTAMNINLFARRWGPLCFGIYSGAILFGTAARAKELPHLEWNPKTLSLIQANGNYARIIRLQDERLICGFDWHGKICIRPSLDDGKTWQGSVEVASRADARLTNTELLQLRDKTILCFYNVRPRHMRPRGETTGERDPRATNESTRPYSICLARSNDGGKSWQSPETLYEAGPEFTNGCWEPVAIQLPSGEVQMFFSNEGPYRQSDEQEITLLRSIDNARTWSAPEKISFRPGGRDGMAVPVLLRNGKGLAFAIEDNGLNGSFKPVIVFTSLLDNWHSGVREPGNSNRWSALQKMLPSKTSASAPYLRQLPSGETLLSVQQSETGEMETARMTVYIGNENARDFASPTEPFPAKERAAQLWNSLFVKNADTVIAVSETSIGGQPGIWSVEGKLVRR